MSDKQLQFGTEARESLLKGINILAEAVGSTLGPKGQCVVIDDYADGKPLITKDGVTVARNIQLSTKFENLGCQLLKEASTATLSGAGDGTTTTVVLAQAMIKIAEDLIKSGVNPIIIKNEIEQLGYDVSKAIKDQAIPIEDKDIFLHPPF